MKTQNLKSTFFTLLAFSTALTFILPAPAAEARRGDVVYASASEAKASLDDFFAHLRLTQFSNCKLVSDSAGKGMLLTDQNGHSLRLTSETSLEAQTLNLRLSDRQPALTFAIEGQIRGFRKIQSGAPASKLLIYVETTKDGKAIKSIRTRLESRYLVDVGTIARPEKEQRGSVDYDSTCFAK